MAARPLRQWRVRGAQEDAVFGRGGLRKRHTTGRILHQAIVGALLRQEGQPKASETAPMTASTLALVKVMR